VPPGGALRVAFRVDPGWEALEARLLVDGEDVTDRCGERVAATFPASRIELVYTPPDGWAPGRHEASVLAPGEPPQAWTFTAG
jgi:hypothetical protein